MYASKCDPLQQKVPYDPCYMLLVCYWYHSYINSSPFKLKWIWNTMLLLVVSKSIIKPKGDKDQQLYFLLSSWSIHYCLVYNVCESDTSASRLKVSFALTGGNWQKWKRVFLTCPCHKMYRDEAVGLKSCKYTWKLRNLWKWEIGAISWKFDILSITS